MYVFVYLCVSNFNSTYFIFKAIFKNFIFHFLENFLESVLVETEFKYLL